MPSTPRAITIAKIVAQVVTASELGSSFFDSTVSCAVEAASSALADLGGAEGLRTENQPVRRACLDMELLQRMLGDHRVRAMDACGQSPDLLDRQDWRDSRLPHCTPLETVRLSPGPKLELPLFDP